MNTVRPTVFSDGSTFDYTNGYRANGAPVATRDRSEVPRIVQTGAIMSTNSLANLLIGLIFLTALGYILYSGVSNYHAQSNEKAIIDTINSSGQATVMGGKMISEDGKDILIVRDNADNSPYKCEVTTVLDPTAKALIFCSPGPANFNIPVPYGPENIFYTTPAQDH